MIRIKLINVPTLRKSWIDSNLLMLIWIDINLLTKFSALKSITMQVFFQGKIYGIGKMTIIGNMYLALSIW